MKAVRYLWGRLKKTLGFRERIECAWCSGRGKRKIYNSKTKEYSMRICDACGGVG